MEKFSKKAAAELNREKLQVINSNVWHDIQDPMKLRCEFYWLDEYDNHITVEVPLYAVRRAQAKIKHDCCINLVCPSGAFIPSAIEINKNGSIALDLPYEPLILKDGFNAEALHETNMIVTQRELFAVEHNILVAIEQ